MKYKSIFKGMVLAGVLTPLLSTAQTDFNRSIDSVDDLLKFQSEMARTDDKTREELLGREMKLKGMREYARSVAIRAGINAGLESVNQQIQDYSRQLDAIYNFEALMIEGRVVPPVITENNNLFNQTGDQEIRTSGKIYNIRSQAKFSSVAPNWRKYLDFPIESSAYEKYSYAASNLFPTNKLERQVWEEATKQGWEEGVNQAGIMLEQAFDRLNRDYVGMTRYHILALQGDVTLPIVSHYKLYDTNTGSKMVMDENLIKLEVLPTFKSSTLKGIGDTLDIPKDFISDRDDIVRPSPIRMTEQQKLQNALQKQVQDQLNEVRKSPYSDYIVMPKVQNQVSESLQEPTQPEIIKSVTRSSASPVAHESKPTVKQPVAPSPSLPAQTNRHVDVLQTAYDMGDGNIQQQASQKQQVEVESPAVETRQLEPVVTIKQDSPYLKITNSRKYSNVGNASSSQ